MRRSGALMCCIMCPWLGDFCSSYSNDVMLQTVPWLCVSFAYGVRIHPRSPPPSKSGLYVSILTCPSWILWCLQGAFLRHRIPLQPGDSHPRRPSTKPNCCCHPSAGEGRGWKAVADGFIANSFGKCCEHSVTKGFNLI